VASSEMAGEGRGVGSGLERVDLREKILMLEPEASPLLLAFEGAVPPPVPRWNPFGGGWAALAATVERARWRPPARRTPMFTWTEEEVVSHTLEELAELAAFMESRQSGAVEILSTAREPLEVVPEPGAAAREWLRPHERPIARRWWEGEALEGEVRFVDVMRAELREESPEDRLERQREVSGSDEPPFHVLRPLAVFPDAAFEGTWAGEVEPLYMPEALAGEEAVLEERRSFAVYDGKRWIMGPVSEEEERAWVELEKRLAQR